jgi:hypothetical protein
MGVMKPIAQIALLFIATPTYAAQKRDWKQGRLVSVEAVTSPDKGERRYEYVVSDITWSYTMQYEHPVKAPVNRPVKFVIEKDTLVLLDADGKERSAHIEKRERVLLDSPDRLLPRPPK